MFAPAAQGGREPEEQTASPTKRRRISALARRILNANVGIEMKRTAIALILIVIICGCRKQQDAEEQVHPQPVASPPTPKLEEQTKVQFDPVAIVSATSALSPEFRRKTTNANNQIQDIGTNAPNPDL
jgi:hypothetical protein